MTAEWDSTHLVGVRKIYFVGACRLYVLFTLPLHTLKLSFAWNTAAAAYIVKRHHISPDFIFICYETQKAPEECFGKDKTVLISLLRFFKLPGILSESSVVEKFFFCLDSALILVTFVPHHSQKFHHSCFCQLTG